MSDFRNFLNKQLEDPEFKAEWEALQPELSLVQAMICPEGKRSDPEGALGAYRHCSGRHQQAGKRQRKSFSADAAAPCRRYGNAGQN